MFQIPTDASVSLQSRCAHHRNGKYELAHDHVSIIRPLQPNELDSILFYLHARVPSLSSMIHHPTRSIRPLDSRRRRRPSELSVYPPLRARNVNPHRRSPLILHRTTHHPSQDPTLPQPHPPCWWVQRPPMPVPQPRPHIHEEVVNVPDDHS